MGSTSIRARRSRGALRRGHVPFARTSPRLGPPRRAAAIQTPANPRIAPHARGRPPRNTRDELARCRSRSRRLSPRGRPPSRIGRDLRAPGRLRGRRFRTDDTRLPTPSPRMTSELAEVSPPPPCSFGEHGRSVGERKETAAYLNRHVIPRPPPAERIIPALVSDIL